MIKYCGMLLEHGQMMQLRYGSYLINVVLKWRLGTRLSHFVTCLLLSSCLLFVPPSSSQRHQDYKVFLLFLWNLPSPPPSSVCVYVSRLSITSIYFNKSSSEKTPPVFQSLLILFHLLLWKLLFGYPVLFTSLHFLCFPSSAFSYTCPGVPRLPVSL